MARDEHVILLPQELAEGTYSIAVGLYDPRTMERLPALDRDQRLPNDVSIVQHIAF